MLFSGHQEINQQLMMMLDEPYARPQSVINIVEIPDASETNPQPEYEGEKQLGEFLSQHKLVSSKSSVSFVSKQEKNNQS